MSSKFTYNKSKLTYTAIISLVLVVVMAGVQIYERKQRYEIPSGRGVESVEDQAGEGIQGIPYSEERQGEESSGGPAEGEQAAEIVVHIAGEVQQPAVITIAAGSRLIEAVEQVGGLTDQADQRMVNLAQELVDGAQYIIPAQGEAAVAGGTNNNPVAQGSSSASDKVNINTADESLLQKLDGVGPVLAQRIIEYREEQGGFKNVSDLLMVKGIGEGKYEAIKDHVVV